MAIIALDVSLQGSSDNTYLFGPTIISECRYFRASSAFKNGWKGNASVSSVDYGANTYVYPDLKLTLSIQNSAEIVIYEKTSDMVGQTLVGSSGDYELPSTTFTYDASKLTEIANYVRKNKISGNTECVLRRYAKIPSGADEGRGGITTTYKQMTSYQVTLLINAYRFNVTDFKGTIATTPHYYSNALNKYLVNGEAATLNCSASFGWDIVEYSVSCNCSDVKYEDKNHNLATGGTEKISFQWQKTYSAEDSPNALYQYHVPEYSISATDYLGNTYDLTYGADDEVLWTGFVHYNTFAPIVEEINCVGAGGRAKFTAKVKYNPMPVDTNLWMTGSASGAPDAYLNQGQFSAKYYYLISKNSLVSSENVAVTVGMESMDAGIVTFEVQALGAASLSTARSWYIGVMFKDNYGSSNTRYFVIPCATAFMDFNDDAQHMAIGKVQETSGLECQWDVKFLRDVYYLSGGKQMSDCAKNIPYTDTYGIGATTVQQAINWIMNKIGG